MGEQQLCNSPGCEKPSSHSTQNRQYCREHYVIAMRRSMNRDQRVFLKADFRKELVHGPHAGASVRARLNKVDNVYFLGLTHEDPKEGNKSMTFQNLSATDLKSLSSFFKEIADNIDSHE